MLSLCQVLTPMSRSGLSSDNSLLTLFFLFPTLLKLVPMIRGESGVSRSSHMSMLPVGETLYTAGEGTLSMSTLEMSKLEMLLSEMLSSD